MADRVVIRSYRRVFEVDRRIYRVDRWALPVAGGVPLRAVAYFAATVLAMVVLGRLPGARELVGLLSPPLRYVVVPLAVAVLGIQAAPDGRSAHRLAAGWLRLRARGVAPPAASLGVPAHRLALQFDDPRGFARADHCDHIHWGMDA